MNFSKQGHSNFRKCWFLHDCCQFSSKLLKFNSHLLRTLYNFKCAQRITKRYEVVNLNALINRFISEGLDQLLVAAIKLWSIFWKMPSSQEGTVDIENYIYVFCKGSEIVFGLFLHLIVAICIFYDLAVRAATCSFSLGLCKSGLYFWIERPFVWSWVHCFLTRWLVSNLQSFN